MQKSDDQLTRDELLAKLATARQEFKKLREEKNQEAVGRMKGEVELTQTRNELVMARKELAAQAEMMELMRQENDRLSEAVAAAGKDNRLVGMVAECRKQAAHLGQVLDAVGQILNGDQLMANLPNHPLLTTADAVVSEAGTAVSWRRVAERRFGVLDTLLRLYDAAGGRPSSPDWVQAVNAARTELLERVDLP